MTAISEDKVLDLTRELVGRPTPNPPGNEGVLVEFLLDRLAASSVDFELETQEVKPDRPNLIARAGNPDKGSLLLTGHMDTVPAVEEDWTGDPFELRIDGERIVGRGVSDMTGALAAKVIAAEDYLTDTPDPGEVILAFAVDEERGGAGTQALVERGLQADAAILGEPTDMRVGIAHKGALRYDLTVRGRNAHSGRPDQGSNALGKMNRVIDAIEELNREMREIQHDLLPPGASVSVTEAEGGIAPNIIPAKASITIDWRFLPGMDDTPAPFDRRLERELNGLTMDGDPIDVEIDRWDFGRAVEVSPDEPIVHAVEDAAKDAGLPGEHGGVPGGTDARYLVHDAGIPTVMFGPGNLTRDAHTVDESIRLDDLVTTMEVYRLAAERFLD